MMVMASKSTTCGRIPMWLLVLLATLSVSNSRVIAQIFDDRHVAALHQDPELIPPGYRVLFYDNMRPTWYAALQDDDPELRRLAADTITKAHRLGMQRLEDSVDELLKLLRRNDIDRMTRRAAATALVELDAKQAAEELASRLADSDLDYAQAVEPALARWDYKPMREQWLQRLDDSTFGRVRLTLAFECLGIVRESAAAEDLLRRALDANESLTLRLAAARAVSLIETTGLVEKAKSISGSERLADRLIATTLLGHHHDPAAITLLREMGRDSAPTVAGSALRTLLKIDPTQVYLLAADAIQSADANVRHAGAEALAHQSNVDAVHLLAPLLDDQNRELRRFVSNALVTLAGNSDELKTAVIEEAVKTLGTDNWRGLEQSLFILGTLDHEPAADRMIELLPHRRPEVAVAAAWGLRRVAVADALPHMLAYATEWADRVLADAIDHMGTDRQLSELFQAFGLQNYAEADPLMRRFIPKTNAAQAARPGAVWGLGWIHKDKAPPDLTEQFVGRLTDVFSPLPEFDPTRRASAVSLARMRSESTLETLREFAEFSSDFATLACIWSVHYLTGEELPKPGPAQLGLANWFLVPHDFGEATERAIR